MRRFEWLIVLDTGLALGNRFFMGNDFILSIDGFITVESFLWTNTLREGFVLQFALMVESFFFSKLSRTVIIIFHIRYVATKRGHFTSLSFFGWIGQEVSWLNNHTTVFVTVLFLDISSLILMFIGSLDWHCDLFCRPECTFVTSQKVAVLSGSSSQNV